MCAPHLGDSDEKTAEFDKRFTAFAWACDRSQYSAEFAFAAYHHTIYWQGVRQANGSVATVAVFEIVQETRESPSKTSWNVLRERRAKMDDTLNLVIDVARRHVKPGCSDRLDDPDIELSAIGLGSLEIVGFLVDLEMSLGIRFPAETINAETFRTMRTVAEVAHKIGGQARQ